MVLKKSVKKQLDILIVGGNSNLAVALKPVLSEFSKVLTAGRKNCDISMDLNDPIDKIRLPQKFDVVIQTASHFGGNGPIDFLAAETTNVLGTLKLCKIASDAKVEHFILVSSIYTTLNEGSEYYGAYSLSKKHAEEAARYYCAVNSLLLTILRPSQMYGDGESFRIHQPFFYTIVDKAERGENIDFYGTNDALRNFIHVEDVANVIARVVQKRLAGTFQCAHPSNVTFSQIARAAFSAFQTKGTVRFLSDKPSIPDNVFELKNLLYKKILFSPKISIKTGMKKIWKHRNAVK